MTAETGVVRAEAATPSPSHLPVMWAQVMDGLRVLKDGRYLDGTFGRGGHARGVLDRLGPEGRLLLMDKDPVAIACAVELSDDDARVALYRGSFAALANWSETAEGLDGVLFDLGVSSPQLDVAERGFSFRSDGPLDMRMDNESGESAGQWLARADEREIADVLWTYGEEKQSRKIARTLVSRRLENPILRTAQLAELIASVVGRGEGKIDPATRSFQAIRIFINRELEDLEAGLAAAHSRLKPGGRLAVISFHSLEDRIVKQFIAQHAKAPAGNRRLPVAQAFTPTLLDIGGAQRADDSETRLNPRARSAVLRVAEKLGGVAMSLRSFMISVLLAAVLTSAVAVVYARHLHRQAYVELTRLEHARDELNIEFSRLQLEQATWSETNRIEQVASERLGMKFPEDGDIVVVQP